MSRNEFLTVSNMQVWLKWASYFDCRSENSTTIAYLTQKYNWSVIAKLWTNKMGKLHFIVRWYLRYGRMVAGP